METHDYTYTLLDIAKAIDTNESNLRYWLNKYEAYVPFIGSGRNKRFSKDSMKVLRSICECRKNGFNAAKISESLSKQFPKIVRSDFNEKDLIVLPQNALADKFDTLIEAINRSNAAFEIIAALLERLIATQHPSKEVKKRKKPIKSSTSNNKQRKHIVAQITSLHNQGWSYEKIARELNRKKTKTFSGRGKWHGKTVSRLLQSNN